MEYEIDTELSPRSDSPGLNDEIDKTVENNGEVRPEQYPQEDRAQQTAVVIPEEGEKQGQPTERPQA